MVVAIMMVQHHTMAPGSRQMSKQHEKLLLHTVKSAQNSPRITHTIILMNSKLISMSLPSQRQLVSDRN